MNKATHEQYWKLRGQYTREIRKYNGLVETLGFRHPDVRKQDDVCLSIDESISAIEKAEKARKEKREASLKAQSK